MMSTGRVSLIPTDFVQGGLIDDIDATIAAARFCFWDYDKPENGVTGVFLGLVLQTDDGKEHAQYYSAGDPEFFEPGDADGTWLRAKGTRPAVNNNTNMAMFLTSLAAAGFPQDRLNTLGINEALVGLKAHFNQVAQPKRKGLIKTGQGAGENEREKTVLLISAILGLPGQVAAVARPLGMGVGATPKPTVAVPVTPVARAVVAPANPGPSATPAAPSNGAAGADDDTLVLSLYEILSENGGAVTKAVLPSLAFKKLLTHPKKAQLVPRMYSQEFLSTAPGISYDGATVKMQ